MSDLLNQAKALRDQAWEAVTQTPQYKAFQAMKVAVEQMTHADLGAELKSVPRGIGLAVQASYPKSITGGHLVRADSSNKVTQIGAALEALRKAREPLPIGRLTEAAMKEGANIGGADPVANFRSTLSKDPRLASIMRNGMYFWWFTDQPTPAGWASGAELDLEEKSAPAVGTSEKGGDDRAATTAN